MGKTTSGVFGLTPKVRAVLFAVAGVSMSYAAAFLAVAYAYRKGYGIVGKPDLVLQSLARSLLATDSS